MAETKQAAIGLTWEPKIPTLSSSSSSSSNAKPQIKVANSTDLIDGLYVPPNDPRKLNKLARKEVKDTAGKSWFEMPAATITPELKKELQLIKLRGYLDPKRFYKKEESNSKTLPKYFQVGTVVESPFDFFSNRLTKKERKTSFANEVLSNNSLAAYRKRKVNEIEENYRPGGNEKWKNKGKQSHKRAKDRRQ